MNNRDNETDNEIDNNHNNLIYNDYNIYNEQNNIHIEYIYNISYLNYKKNIFTSSINEDYKLILSLFDENICDILTNIFILKKKNKITEKQFVAFKLIFDYAVKISNIVFIDTENFLPLLIDFYKLKNSCVIINIFFEDYIFKDLIDYKMLVDKILLIYKKLSDRILLFKICDELNKTNSSIIIKNKIVYLAKKISFDLFMFCSSQNIYDIILSGFLYIENLYINIETKNDEIKNNEIQNNKIQIIKENKNLLNVFEMHKIYFIKEYDKNAKKYFNIYINDIELYIKFKINKTDIIDKFISNIKYVESM